MFGFLKKNKTDDIYSPVKGKSIPIEQVPDKMFANKLLGDGIGFVFKGDTVYAPCDGEIVMVANTKHAFGLKTKAGAEVLVHVGLDTVSLNGEGLEILVKVGSKVKTNQPVIKINRQFVEDKNIDLTTPMIITNMSDFNVEIKNSQDVDLETLVIHVEKK